MKDLAHRSYDTGKNKILSPVGKGSTNILFALQFRGFSYDHPGCHMAAGWCVMLFYFLLLFRGNTDKEDNTEDKVDGLQKAMVSH